MFDKFFIPMKNHVFYLLPLWVLGRFCAEPMFLRSPPLLHCWCPGPPVEPKFYSLEVTLLSFIMPLWTNRAIIPFRYCELFVEATGQFDTVLGLANQRPWYWDQTIQSVGSIRFQEFIKCRIARRWLAVDLRLWDAGWEVRLGWIFWQSIPMAWFAPGKPILLRVKSWKYYQIKTKAVTYHMTQIIV